MMWASCPIGVKSKVQKPNFVGCDALIAPRDFAFTSLQIQTLYFLVNHIMPYGMKNFLMDLCLIGIFM